MKGLTQVEMTLSEKAHHLESSEWADNFDGRQLDTIASYLSCYTAPIEFTVLKENEMNDFFCLLTEGQVNVTKENGAGEAKKIHAFGPGKFFGEISFFDNSSCSASIIVSKPATLLLFNKTSFKKFCDDAPSVALTVTLGLIKNMSRRLKQTTGRLVDLI